MDPLHITEFASTRYFDKLKSLSEAAASNTNAAASATSTESPLGPPQSTPFTLPLGNPRPRRRRSDDNSRPNNDKREKLEPGVEPEKSSRRPSFGGSLLSIRSKISLGHKAPPVPFLDHAKYTSVETYVPVVQKPRQSFTLNELFLSLPNELQVQIITPLPMPTILNLRLVSKDYHNIVAINETQISRYHVNNSVPSYALKLYPLPAPSQINLQYLCGLWHRLHVAQKLAVAISEHTTKEIFLRDTEAKWREFLPQHTRMRRRLMPLIFTIFHFLETSRSMHVAHLQAGGLPLRMQPFTLNPIEKAVMDLYDDELLLKVHQVFPLVLSSFSRRLRPPSYAGRLERSFKGMLKDKPADEIYATILAVGGLRQAERFWQTKGYNTRRAAVDTWYNFVSQEPVEASTKSKFSLLSRKKEKVSEAVPVPQSTAGHDPITCQEWYCVKPYCNGPRARRPSLSSQSRFQNQLIPTSLTYGPPMGPLSREQLRLLLPDLQPLQNIWLLTAEAVVLDREIVENSAKIKRNTQVLLELIKEIVPESGVAPDEEEWSPGLSQTSRRDLENFTGDADTFQV